MGNSICKQVCFVQGEVETGPVVLEKKMTV